MRLDRLQNIYIFLCLSEIQNDFIAWHSFYIGPYVKMEKKNSQGLYI